MTRRTFARIAIGAVLPIMGTAGADAQPAKKTARIAYLSPGERGFREWLIKIFVTSLRERGWSEGENLVIEYRFGGERYEALRALAAEMVRLKVDLIFAASAPSAQAAKEATSTIPIVFSTFNDPVQAGFVASFARPGGNMTGQAGLGPELDRKRFELVTELVPSLSRMTILLNPTNPMTPQRLAEATRSARALKLQIDQVNASGGKTLEEALRTIARSRPAALLVFEDPILISHRQRIIDFSAQQRLPTVYTSPGWADRGGLVEYGPNQAEMYRRAAEYVDRILRGAKPRDLPVEQPTKFDLVINLRTAGTIGLSIPHSLLLRADRVIQ